MSDAEHPDLHRYWIEFAIPVDEYPEASAPGTVSLDGGSDRYRLLHQGVGVTGYDSHDCLEMLRDVLGADLPPVTAVTADPDLSGPEWDGRLERSGSPVWRSVWFPLLRDRPRYLH